MIEIIVTHEFEDWYKALDDPDVEKVTESIDLLG